MIEIQKKVNPKLNSYIIIDIFANEYDVNNKFRLPINRYIFDTFNDINNITNVANKYHINVNQKNTSQFLIELSAQYNEIKIEFEKNISFEFKNKSGFKKYRIYNTDSDNIIFKVVNPKNKSANYMIR